MIEWSIVEFVVGVTMFLSAYRMITGRWPWEAKDVD